MRTMSWGMRDWKASVASCSVSNNVTTAEPPVYASHIRISHHITVLLQSPCSQHQRNARLINKLACYTLLLGRSTRNTILNARFWFHTESGFYVKTRARAKYSIATPGYGHTVRAWKPTTIAVYPVGDGTPDINTRKPTLLSIVLIHRAFVTHA
jgi:hypothetical protein